MICSPKQRGFVTMATGDEKYYQFARNLLYSYRLHNKKLPFGIICDRENEYTKILSFVSSKHSQKNAVS